MIVSHGSALVCKILEILENLPFPARALTQRVQVHIFLSPLNYLPGAKVQIVTSFKRIKIYSNLCSVQERDRCKLSQRSSYLGCSVQLNFLFYLVASNWILFLLILSSLLQFRKHAKMRTSSNFLILVVAALKLKL